MRSLKYSRFTEKSPQRLLDIAYLVVLIPLLTIVKLPILLYMLLVFVLLLMHKKPTTLTLLLVAFVGLLALFLSLYGVFNLTGLSQLSLFVELLIYLLILAVSLQRLTRTINFYLIVSPILLMALSLFFFHSIVMLIYVVIEIFLLLWLILAYRIQGSLRETFRMAAMYFASSLPWVVLLFIFFPRISFEHASYGFRGDEIRRMGHDGTMYLDSKALLVPSDRIVMEVGFETKVPPADQLYFRGSLLYIDKKNHWEALPASTLKQHKPHYDSIRELIVYKVTLYPTQKRWLYLLDLPVEAPEGATIDANFVTTLEEKIREPQHYEATSALRYDYGREVLPEIRKAASDFEKESNPRSLTLAEEIRKKYPDPDRRSAAIIELFRGQNLRYSLRPKPLDLNHSTDSFLFQNKNGYCVHFAASFVTFARMAGIPARIVTGYKGDPKNSVNNYLIIKERDAHAWAELLIDYQWRRIETTALASSISDETQQLLSEGERGGSQNRLLKQANLYLMYLKYQAETWILQYSHFRQMQLFDRVKKDTAFVLKFAGALLLLILASIASIAYFRRPLCKDQLLCFMQPLLKKLKREEFERRDGETMHAYLCRYLDANPSAREIGVIDRLYESIRYGDDHSEESWQVLEEKIRQFIKRRRATSV